MAMAFIACHMPYDCCAIESMKWIESHMDHALVHFSSNSTPSTGCRVNCLTVGRVFRTVAVMYRRHCLDDGSVLAMSCRPFHYVPHNHYCHRNIWWSLISNFLLDDSLVSHWISCGWQLAWSSSFSWSSFWVAVALVWMADDDQFVAMVSYDPCHCCSRMSR